MNPRVLITVNGGVVTGVSTNIPGVEVQVEDQDGADVRPALTYTGPWDVEPLTEAERERFFDQMEGNLEGS
jgi:hypothetical protein